MTRADAGAPRRPPRPRVETAAVFYGVTVSPQPGPEGSAYLVAGDLRVQLAADGSVRTAPETLPTTVRWRWPLRDGRWGFVTTDDQVIVTDGFLGPVVIHAAMPAAVVRHGTGAVPAVRTDDGVWHRFNEDGPSPMGALGAGVTAVHFVDDRRGWALRAPGEALQTQDGGARWTPVALPGDIALRLDFDAQGALLVQGAHARYAPQGDTLTATDTPAQPEPALAPADRARVLDRWAAHWRAHRWPAGAPGFWFEHEGRIHPTMEHRDALWWWSDGAVKALGRDGALRQGPIAGAATCRLSRFGARVFAACSAYDAQRFFTVDAATAAATPLGGLFPLDASVHAAEDGGAVVVRMPGLPSPHRVWTPAAPSFRALPGIPPEAEVSVEGGRLLARARSRVWVAALASEAARWTAVRLDDDASSGEVRAARLRADGGYALVRQRAGAQGCEVLLGADADPVTRGVIPGCEAPTAVAFVDARFGVVVDGYRAWVTDDGGARWSARSRPVGGSRDESPGILARASLARIEGDAVVVAPWVRFTRSDAPPGLFRARAPLPLRHASDPREPGATQYCEAAGASRLTRPEPDDAATRPRLLAHQSAVATLALRRDGDSVQARIAWEGDDGAGRFEGVAPWGDALADFTRGAVLGYALRGVSAAGALLERCEIAPTEGRVHDARGCSTVWLTPDGRALPITLQNGLPRDGARVHRAAPDGLGWVLELGPGDGDTRWEWVQWQHRNPDGSVARWGDLTRDLQLGEGEDLARVGGRWGVRTAAGFIAHGEVALHPMPAPDAAVSFCRGPIAEDADLWLAGTGSARVVPRLLGGGPARWTLRRSVDGWCVAGGHDAPPRFFWSTATHRPLFPAWSLRPDGRGVRRSVEADGSVLSRATRCDPPPR